MSMTSTATSRFICVGCGTQHDDAEAPPAVCAICTDDRQHVPPGGQRWTTHDALTHTHTNRIGHDADLLGVGVTERFAIPQRALLVTGELNVLWDCVSLVTDDAVEAITAQGGLDAIAISHPHFYASMVEWSDAFGGVPIYLHGADRTWVQRRSPNIVFWDGDDFELASTIRLLHVPGHFPGSAALHWSDGPARRQLLLAGDSLHVADDRAHITVMHSVPNFIPVSPGVIADIRARLAGVDFDDLYGFTWDRNIIGDARRAVDRSLERYTRHVTEPALAV